VHGAKGLLFHVADDLVSRRRFENLESSFTPLLAFVFSSYQTQINHWKDASSYNLARIAADSFWY
jgi:hypothetical protein